MLKVRVGFQVYFAFFVFFCLNLEWCRIQTPCQNPVGSSCIKQHSGNNRFQKKKQKIEIDQQDLQCERSLIVLPCRY